MAEQTKGGGFRERIYFDAELWHEIEALSAHMRLKPTDVVRMLTAMGVAQMKALTQMGRAAQAAQGVIQDELEADFEHMTGVSASSPITTAPPSPDQGGTSAPGRGNNRPLEAVQT